MSTSADRLLPDGAAVRLRGLPYRDRRVQRLVERVQQEYVARYGSRDGAVVDPAEFEPPAGLFLVAEVGGVPAGCGAWRTVGQDRAEIKRMYVEPAFRRRGLARVILDALESSAASTGVADVVLNSGDRQPEALALYAEAGYTMAPGYGVYADAPGAVFLGKELSSVRAREESEHTWAS